jgi:hypothetical protein
VKPSGLSIGHAGHAVVERQRVASVDAHADSRAWRLHYPKCTVTLVALSLRTHSFAHLALLHCSLLGCDKTREIVHDMTKPDPGPDGGAVVVLVVHADAGPAPVASVSAAVDAGKPASASPRPSGTPAAKKTPPPKLNGLPAGAVCLQGKEGNGGCASGSECANGKCTCYNGWTSCGGACRDLSRDPYNCDKCGHECTYGQYCKWGHCE